MSTNNYRPHLLIIPEDAANVDLALGVSLSANVKRHRITIERAAGGYLKALEKYKADIDASMRQFTQRLVVLLIDFDGEHDRFATMMERLPPEHKNRVFILGVFKEPEDLKRAFHYKTLENLGGAMLDGCPKQMSAIWQHELLKHNQEELLRLKQEIKGMGDFLWQQS